MIGWQLLSEESYVDWCRHQWRVVLVPHADGVRAPLMPTLDEAA